MTVISRFAPSPTGHMHIGSVRTALITWLFVRSQGGQYILRIDDTDLERSKEEYTESIKRDLTWLGLNWDRYEHQRGREAVYQAALDKLKADSRLYPCYETADELGLKRKSLLSRGLPPIYDRAALSLTEEQIAKYEAEGRKPHWRFKLNHEPIEWTDLVRGPVSFHGKDMSDPVLVREDGTPLYHICSVVDDIEYGVNHVIRGEDHVSNTAFHIQMIEALGGEVPTYAHLALLAGEDGGKLSKRVGSLGVADLRVNGIDPRAICSVMARLGSSDPIELFTDMDDIVKQFDISKFSRSATKFSMDEIERLNVKLVHEKSYDEVKNRLEEIGVANDVDEFFWQVAQPNLTRISDIKEWVRVAKGPVDSIIDDEDKDFLRQAAELLPSGEWNNDTWMNWANAVKEKTGRKGKGLFMPLRKALTGMEHGPELNQLLQVIGYDRAKERLLG